LVVAEGCPVLAALGDPVGEQHQRVARREFDGLIGEVDVGHDAEQASWPAALGDVAAGSDQQRQGMAGDADDYPGPSRRGCHRGQSDGAEARLAATVAGGLGGMPFVGGVEEEAVQVAQHRPQSR
jgi:hypothetical protein